MSFVLNAGARFCRTTAVRRHGKQPVRAGRERRARHRPEQQRGRQHARGQRLREQRLRGQRPRRQRFCSPGAVPRGRNADRCAHRARRQARGSRARRRSLWRQRTRRERVRPRRPARGPASRPAEFQCLNVDALQTTKSTCVEDAATFSNQYGARKRVRMLFGAIFQPSCMHVFVPNSTCR